MGCRTPRPQTVEPPDEIVPEEEEDETQDDRAGPEQARIQSRPGTPAAGQPVLGLQPLRLSSQRDGVLYVPPGYRTSQPAPAVLMLHGANSSGQRALDLLRPLADGSGLILVAPDSRGSTWDMLLDERYGPDVAFLDVTLQTLFERYAVDPDRLAIGGFSDGASYALSLGITNGDLFSHILAFSPGFAAPFDQRGVPRIFVSHGTRDQVLPIDACSRKIVPMARGAGYDVRYREFDGAHTLPAEVAHEAVRWLKGELA
jgi:phospholipase/carboxylesterase